MSKLFKLKEWFTLGETAKYLTVNFGEDVAEADVLQLALDGHLVLSVNLITSEMGHCGKLVPIEDAEFEDIEMFEGKPPVRIYGGVRVSTGDEETHILQLDEEVVRLRGIYDLSMIGGEKDEVANRYRELVGEQRVSLSSLDGVFLLGGDDKYIQLLEDLDDNEFQSGSAAQLERIRACIVFKGLSDDEASEMLKKHEADRAEFLKKRSDDPRRYYPAGGLARRDIFVVRNESLSDLLQKVSDQDIASKNTHSSEKPLSTTERNTLLKLVIGMAMDSYGYDPTAAKNAATAQIVGDLAKYAIKIDEGTVLKYLKEAASTVTYNMPIKT